MTVFVVLLLLSDLIVFLESVGTDPPDVLDRQKCLDALAALRHAKWFQVGVDVVGLVLYFCNLSNQQKFTQGF